MTLALPNLPDWLAHRATTSEAREALVVGGRRWSYGELDAEVTRLARRLGALGVGAGDRIATLLHNGPVASMIVHAALRLGATLVPLNVRLSDEEIAWQAGDAGARLLVVEERTTALAERTRLALPNLPIVSVDTLDATPESMTELHLSHDPAHVLAIIYTSGTTGRPKGAMLTVGNFWWSAVGSALNLGADASDRWLACMPLFHVGGLSILLRAAIHGFAAVVHDGFDAHAVNRALHDEGVTMLSVVAVMLQRMLDANDGRAYPSTLRCVLAGGGPVPRPLLERCATLGVPVVQTYGLTETCSQIATLAPEDALRRIGAAGRPLYPNELRVVRTSGEEADAGEAGEIVARGPVVMAGYAGQPEATARALAGGWLHTGDIGHLDADGLLYLLDRRDDLIVTGGENVYPSEVEEALLAHRWVIEAAVIGLPDSQWGQRVVAVVRLGELSGATEHAVEGAADGTAHGAAPGADPRDVLKTHCRSRLGGYKVPREIRVVTEPLPRTASGKLRRRALREQIVSVDGLQPDTPDYLVPSSR